MMALLILLLVIAGICISIHDAAARKGQPYRAAPKVEGSFTGVLDEDERLTCPSWVVLDVETTGLKPDSDRVIEFSAQRYIDGQLESAYATMVNPVRHLPPEITSLTGLTDRDLKGAPRFSVIAPEIVEFIGDLPVVAHNAKFDAQFLVRECGRAGIALHLRYIDTVALARWAYPGAEDYKLKTLIRGLRLLDHEQEHRASSDVEATAKLYLLCRKKLAGDRPPEPVTYRAASEPVEEDDAPQPRPVTRSQQVADRRRAAAEAGLACCPRCGSTSVSLNKKGFGGGKATAGMFLTGSLGGAVAGTYGMNKMKLTCLNCGYRWKPGRKGSQV